MAYSTRVTGMSTRMDAPDHSRGGAANIAWPRAVSGGESVAHGGDDERRQLGGGLRLLRVAVGVQTVGADDLLQVARAPAPELRPEVKLAPREGRERIEHGCADGWA